MHVSSGQDGAEWMSSRKEPTDARDFDFGVSMPGCVMTDRPATEWTGIGGGGVWRTFQLDGLCLKEYGEFGELEETALRALTRLP